MAIEESVAQEFVDQAQWNVLEHTNNLFLKLRNEYRMTEIPCLDFVKAYNYCDDLYAIFYMDSYSKDWKFYANAPAFHTAIKDIIAEMPQHTDMANRVTNEFIVTDGKDYFRIWKIIPLND